MYPYRTAIITLLFFNAANTQDPYDAVFVNSNLYAHAEGPNVADESQYWWMNKGSPFKRSFPSPNEGSFHGKSGNLDLSSNPFLNGNSISSEISYAASNQNAKIDMSHNPFLSNLFAAASNDNFGAGSYVAPGYLPPQKEPIKCNGQGNICVPKPVCNNGYIDSAQTGSQTTCNADGVVCCAIRYAPSPSPSANTPQPVSVRTTVPYQPQPQTTSCTAKNHGCVLPDLCVNNEAIKLPNAIESTKCYAPEVCCRYKTPTQATFPPKITPAFVTNEGYAITIPKTKFTQKPTSPPVVTARVPYTTSQKPYVPPTSTPQTHTPYQPAQTQTQKPYIIPPPQTQKPYHPITVGTKPSYKAEEYIPPKDNHIGQPSNTNIYTKIPPTPPTPPTPPPQRGEEQKSELIPRPSNQNTKIIRPGGLPPPLPPIQCPAATNCTEIQFCTAEGVMSKTPIVLTKDQETFRVPLSDCRHAVKGYNGKCCRDPDYVDPWPVGILGQYNASILGFDDGTYNPEKVNNRQQPKAVRGQSQLSLPIAVTAQTQNTYTRTPFPQQPSNQIFQRDKVTPYPNEPIASASQVCAIRDVDSFPRGPGPIDAGFGEFPWQAMILKESTKTLLCGGAIIQANTVVTAAHCVKGLKPFDVLIKGGEWRLGSDEEPKPFQTIRVKSISIHPEYQSAIFGRNVALLHLENKLKFDKHIGPICIEENEIEPNPITDICVTTGWGKEVLKYHAADALMHSIPVDTLTASDCEAALSGNGFNSKSSVCGRPKSDACQTDVGSALACDMGNGKYLLKGVYATENECGPTPNQLITFSKMDVKWLKETMHTPDLRPEVSQPSRTTYIAQPNTPQITYSIPSTQAPSYLPPVH